MGISTKIRLATPCGLIGRVAVIEIVGPVLTRALQPFPILVRTLDAIHLSALELIVSYRLTKIRTCSICSKVLADHLRPAS
jgi:hypothetical protein